MCNHSPLRLADCALVLALRHVLEERWRAGGACLRPNELCNTNHAYNRPQYHLLYIPLTTYIPLTILNTEPACYTTGPSKQRPNIPLTEVIGAGNHLV